VQIIYKIIFFKCQNPTINIISRQALFRNATVYKKSDFVNIVSSTKIICNLSTSNHKQWEIYLVSELNGLDKQQIHIVNNPTLNFAELVLQPNSLNYGIYRIVYSVTMSGTSNSVFTSQIDTFIQIFPTGLVISALKSSQPIYGGTIEITRGFDQKIEFDPFINSFDIDSVAVMTSLTFKYSCQIIDSNTQNGYPLIPGTTQLIYLDDFKQSSSLASLNTCFNGAG